MPGKSRQGRPIPPRLDPCEESREVVVELSVDPRDVSVRESVVLSKRNGEVIVTGAQGIIGSVGGEDGSFIANCLEEGFTVTGSINSVSPDEPSAVITVHGIRSSSP